MPRILIVEDENATAWALAESLQEDGHETTTVSSAEDALEVLRGRGADLVITDLRLPGMSGSQLARRLRGARRAVPVIVVTAFGSSEVLEELAGFGVRAVFPKPFRVDQVRRSVREALETVAVGAEGRSPRPGRGNPA
jgi:two-component system response regulator (stage 0 sporulation protein F)